jgi:hypothetical protein
MGKPDLFSVTVSRVNESIYTPPDHTMNAYRVRAEADGSLVIEGNHEDRVFSAGLWDSFRVSRLSVLPGGFNT